MNQVIEVNIADILARLETKMDKLSDDVNQVSKDLAELKTEVKSDIARLDEKITGVGKRLDNLKFIARTVGAGIVVALLLALTRYLFPSVTL